MISKIEKIKNIGNFEDYNASGDVTLKKMNIIYAENGAGKTTLAQILHSLSVNDASIIQCHKRIGATGLPEVCVKDDSNRQHIFNGTRWNNPIPEVAVFDAHFVANNVYTGFDISKDHHKRLYQFVVGDSVVEIVKKVERVKGLIDKQNIDLSNCSSQITATAHESDLSKILNISQNPNIDTEIALKDKELTLAKNNEQILKLPVPAKIKLPEFSVNYEKAKEILQTTVDGIGEEYLKLVQDHLDELQQAGMTQGSAWIHQGSQILKSKCPFCGQSIDGIQLVEGYNQYFSKRYNDAVAEAKSLVQVLSGINIALIEQQVENSYKQISESIKVWNTYITGQSPIPPLELEKIRLSAKYDALRTVFAQKALNPIMPVSVNELDDYNKACIDLIDNCNQINDYVHIYIEKIAELRSKIRPVDIVEKELRSLYLARSRYEQPLLGLCKKYVVLNTQSTRLNKINRELQQQQKTSANSIFTQYGSKINDYLQNIFMTSFKVENVSDGGYRGRGKEPNLDYTITFNGTPIIQGDDGVANTSFRNVLSEGDKNTIAFSFFLSKLINEPNFADKIVVFDDPLTSLDLNRRNATIDQLVWLHSRCKQVIVLSHNLHFLVDLKSRNDISKGNKKVLQIVNSLGKSKISEFELKKEWIDRYKQSIQKMKDFIANPDPSKQEDAINSIRLSLETFLKLKYCLFIPDQDMTFGQIVGELDKKPCTFVNADKNAVITQLNNLVNISWRSHHASVEERALYSEIPLNTTETFNYINKTLQLLEKEL